MSDLPPVEDDEDDDEDDEDVMGGVAEVYEHSEVRTEQSGASAEQMEAPTGQAAAPASAAPPVVDVDAAEPSPKRPRIADEPLRENESDTNGPSQSFTGLLRENQGGAVTLQRVGAMLAPPTAGISAFVANIPAMPFALAYHNLI